MIIGEEEFRSELAAHIKAKYKTTANAASAWGVSRSFAYAVLSGGKPPCKKILDDVGFTRHKIALYESK